MFEPAFSMCIYVSLAKLHVFFVSFIFFFSLSSMRCHVSVLRNSRVNLDFSSQTCLRALQKPRLPFPAPLPPSLLRPSPLGAEEGGPLLLPCLPLWPGQAADPHQPPWVFRPQAPPQPRSHGQGWSHALYGQYGRRCGAMPLAGC